MKHLFDQERIRLSLSWNPTYLKKRLVILTTTWIRVHLKIWICMCMHAIHACVLHIFRELCICAYLRLMSGDLLGASLPHALRWGYLLFLYSLLWLAWIKHLHQVFLATLLLCCPGLPGLYMGSGDLTELFLILA